MTYYWQQVPSAFTWFCNFKNWHNLYQREDNVDNMMILKKKYCYQKYSFINNIVYIWITMLKIRESLTKKDITLFDLTNNSAKNITDWLWLSGICTFQSVDQMKVQPWDFWWNWEWITSSTPSHEWKYHMLK